jgi:hypothetical protein
MSTTTEERIEEGTYPLVPNQTKGVCLRFKKYKPSDTCMRVMIVFIILCIVFLVASNQVNSSDCHEEYPENTNMTKCVVMHHCLKLVPLRKRAKYSIYFEVSTEEGTSTPFSNHEIRFAKTMAEAKSKLPTVGTEYDCITSGDNRVYDISQGFCDMTKIIPSSCVVIDAYTV